MKNNFFILLILLFFYSCNNDSYSSNNLLGTWIHDDELHQKISLELGTEKGNLAGPNAFGEIRMVFKQNNTYISFFDNKKYSGIWKIKKNILYMKRGNGKWMPYDYNLTKDELIIFDREWLMTFTKK